MKKRNKFLLFLAIIILVVVATIPLWQKKTSSHYKTTSRVTQIRKVSKHKKHKATWGYPFKRLYEKRSSLRVVRNLVKPTLFAVRTKIATSMMVTILASQKSAIPLS